MRETQLGKARLQMQFVDMRLITNCDYTIIKETHLPLSGCNLMKLNMEKIQKLGLTVSSMFQTTYICE